MNLSDPPFDFHFDQENVEETARLKWDKPSPELIKSNNQYGIGTILKEYAGLPYEYPLRLAMEQTLHLGDQQPSRYVINSIADTILIPSAKRKPVIDKHTDKRAIPIGFAYLYAKALFEKFGYTAVPEDARKGTLVFPLKVMSTANLQFDHAAYATQLKNYPERFQPVYTCLYYRTVPDIAPIYSDAGIPVVTAGHRFDPLFYHRFHDLCRRFRYAASNEIGTNLFLSVHSGCRFFYLDGPEAKATNLTKNREGQAFANTRAESRRLFSEPVEEITTEQRAYVDSFIGTDYFVSPRKLRHIILQEQRRLEKRPWWHGEKRLFAPPSVVNFAWQEFPQGLGWEGLEKIDGTMLRWIEPKNRDEKPKNEAWVELGCPARLRKHTNILRCRIPAITCTHLELSVNGKCIPDLKRIPDQSGFTLEGVVSPEDLQDASMNRTVRIGFHASGDEIPSEHPNARPRSAAISHISLQPNSQ